MVIFKRIGFVNVEETTAKNWIKEKHSSIKFKVRLLNFGFQISTSTANQVAAQGYHIRFFKFKK